MVRKTPAFPLSEIAELCREYGVSRLAVFGSILREDFGLESDIDFLVTFENDDAGPWGCKLAELEDKLATLLKRPVDVIPRRAIERSRNWIRRNHILDSAVVVYGS